jgi:nucleoside-diphosphate-sugar epimerase
VTRPRLLVLGAGGFLGRHVVDALRAAGTAEVAIASRDPDAAGDATGHRLDLVVADRPAILDVIRAARPDVIVNCSGATRGDLGSLVRGNVTVVADVLAAIAEGAHGARFVHLGSAAEYGAVPVGTPIREDAPPNPVGDYGVTKLAGTDLVLAAGRSGDVDAIVLRVFNPIGAGVPASSVLGRAAAGLRDALAGGVDAIHLGSLDDERDFVDVRDVADAAVAAAFAAGLIGPRIVNIGSGRATRVRDAVTRLGAVAGFDGTIAEDQPVQGAARVRWQQADISAAATTLGWRPRRSLDETIEAVWAGSAVS